MKRYTLSHLSDESLLRGLIALVAQDRVTSAEMLAHIAEVDERKLYLPAGYPSVHPYCVDALHMSEQTAYKRIFAGRAARRFPAILSAVAEGGLHLSAVVLLAAHLTEANANELIGAATHRTKAGVEKLLAERFPQSDLLNWVAVMPEANGEAMATPDSGTICAENGTQLSPGKVDASTIRDRDRERGRMKPLSGSTYALQVTIDQEMHELLGYARNLVGHRVQGGDVTEVLRLVLKAAIPQLEKQKFATTTQPRRRNDRSSTNPRHIPAHVRRAVWRRDGGQRTFVGDGGHRCETRKPLEFDLVLEVARGGEATVENVQLRCRAHNQHAAERTFGAEFMRNKRITAAELRAAARATRAKEAARARRAEEDPEQSVVPWLLALGFSPAEAKRAAERCETMSGAPMEERVRAALASFRVRGTRVETAAPRSLESLARSSSPTAVPYTP